VGEAATVATEESAELPSLLTIPTLETVPEELKEDTDFSVSSGVKDTSPVEDRDAEAGLSK
jgi:hypothetical protein